MPEEVRDPDGRTALHQAAFEAPVDQVRALLVAGADPSVQDRLGYTPLHFACQQNRPDVVRVLLAAGAPVDVRDRHGNTPLWRAVFDCRNDPAVAVALIGAGADPDVTNDSGLSPRDMAVRLGATDVTALFDRRDVSGGVTQQQVDDVPLSSIPVPGVDGLWLRRLQPDDAEAYHALVRRNRVHLTANGDYTDEVAATVDDVRDELSRTTQEDPLRFGIRLHGELVGRCDLVPVDPPRYGLGFWISAEHEGRGLAGACVRALLEAAREHLGATDVYAGVTHGNVRSEALLERSGFTVAARFDTYTRFHRPLGPEGR